MASEEAIKKMIQAILERRRELGMLDWGMGSIEEVLERLKQEEKKQELSSRGENGLESEEN